MWMFYVCCFLGDLGGDQWSKSWRWQSRDDVRRPHRIARVEGNSIPPPVNFRSPSGGGAETHGRGSGKSREMPPLVVLAVDTRILEMAECRFRTSGASVRGLRQFSSSMFIQFSSHARALFLQVFLLVLIAVAVSVCVLVSDDT